MFSWYRLVRKDRRRIGGIIPAGSSGHEIHLRPTLRDVQDAIPCGTKMIKTVTTPNLRQRRCGSSNGEGALSMPDGGSSADVLDQGETGSKIERPTFRLRFGLRSLGPTDGAHIPLRAERSAAVRSLSRQAALLRWPSRLVVDPEPPAPVLHPRRSRSRQDQRRPVSHDVGVAERRCLNLVGRIAP